MEKIHIHHKIKDIIIIASSWNLDFKDNLGKTGLLSWLCKFLKNTL